MFFALLPIVITVIATDVGLPTSDLGTLSSIYMAGYLLASLSAAVWVQKINWRFVLGLTLALNCFGFLLLATSTTLVSLSIAFILCGIVTGANAGIANQVFGSSANPEQSFSLAFTLSFTSQAALIYFVVNHVLPEYGLVGLGVTTAGISCVLYLLGIILIRPIPISSEKIAHGFSALLRPPRRVVLGLLAVLLFQAGWAGVWTFIGVIAEINGIAATTAGQILSLGLILIAAGALFASWLGGRLGTLFPVVLSVLTAIVSIALMVTRANELPFTIAVIGFCFCWGFGVPYLLAILSEADGESRFLVLIGVSQALGSMIGPAMLGTMHTAYQGNSLAISGITFFLVSLAIALLANRGNNSRNRV